MNRLMNAGDVLLNRIEERSEMKLKLLYPIFILLLALCLEGCSKDGSEGKWYEFDKQNVECRIKVLSTLRTQPMAVEGFNDPAYTLSVLWTVERLDPYTTRFSYSKVYIFDKKGNEYFASGGEYFEGGEEIGSIPTSGVSHFFIPGDTDVRDLRVSLVSSNKEICIAVHPKDITDEYLNEMERD